MPDLDVSGHAGLVMADEEIPEDLPDGILERRLPPGRHGLPQDLVFASQRNRILRGLVTSVAARGYGATTVADVIVDAEVSRKTFYKHYPDLEACFLAAYDTIVEGVGRRAVEAVQAVDGDWPDQLATGLDAVLRALAAEPDSARVAIVEVRGAGRAALQRRSDTLASLVSFIEVGNMYAGLDPALPRTISIGILGGLEELVYLRILDDRASELPGLVSELLQLALLPFVGPGQAAADAQRAQEWLLARAKDPQQD